MFRRCITMIIQSLCGFVGSAARTITSSTKRAIFSDRIDAREVAAIVERAWIDNVEHPQDLGYAQAFAFHRFNEVVSEYVRVYTARAGHPPVGDHHVTDSPKAIYFAPRPRSFHVPGFFSAARSSSS